MSDYILSMTVNGQLPSLKNRRRVFRNRKTGAPIIAKSQEAMDYETRFLRAVPESAKVGYEGPVSVKVRVWYQSRRSDLSTELLFDLLQKAGVIANDRQVHHVESFKGLDPERPRVHLTVYPYQEAANA